MNSKIMIDHAVKRYGKKTVIDDVTVTFEEGGIHALIGRNGSGKTVLMKCICGLTPLTEGEIRIGGKRVGKDIEIPRRMGAIIETPGFLPNVSGLKNLELLADIRGQIGTRAITHAMETVGLDPDEKKHVSSYSLGMRQRLGIAQAIMEKPRLMLLDEPMNGLDNDGVAEMRALFRRMCDNGCTILIASHNPYDIIELGDTVHEMDKGKLLPIPDFKSRLGKEQ